jgi:hypothetical protein
MRIDPMQRIRKIANAVLYEGYMLYPYRPSNVKNRQRWTFGGLYPASYAERNGDSSRLHAEVLVKPSDGLTLEIHVRFLHLMAEERRGRMCQRALERDVVLHGVELEGRYSRAFSFSALEDREASTTRRRQRIQGLVEVASGPIDAGLHKLSVRVTNTTDFRGPNDISRDEASMQALVATHAILRAPEGGFVSLVDPPEQYREAASRCSNQGVWPVLAGEPGSTEWMLAPPFILPDYPRIAPESPGDLFDGTEIDEILTLRVLTMTDAEKEEVSQADPRLREMLERTQSLSPEELWKLHGTLRDPRALVPMGGGEA